MPCVALRVSLDIVTQENDVVSTELTMHDDIALSEPEAAKLLHKIGWHVLPMLFIVYLVAFFDRSVPLCTLVVNAPGTNTTRGL